VAHSVHLVHIGWVISLTWIHIKMLIHLVIQWIVRTAWHLLAWSLLVHRLRIERILLILQIGLSLSKDVCCIHTILASSILIV